jgi:hypothetical protein
LHWEFLGLIVIVDILKILEVIDVIRLIDGNTTKDFLIRGKRKTMQQPQYIDYRQDTLEEVEPVLLEAMGQIEPSRSLNSINGSVLSEDSAGQAQI